MREELEEIKKIRVKNNDLWISVLDIALRHAPEETKQILKNIRQNDGLISDYVEDILSDEDDLKWLRANSVLGHHEK